MKIVYKKPWFWFIVMYIQPEAKWGSVILSLGNVIYTARRLSIGEFAHESEHGRQDHYSKIYAIANVIRGYFDKKYYLWCEIQAYIVQNKLEPNPELYARYISGPVYNNIVSYEEALQLFI